MLNRLHTLNLYRTRVTDDGVKELHAALSELELIR